MLPHINTDESSDSSQSSDSHSTTSSSPHSTTTFQDRTTLKSIVVRKKKFRATGLQKTKQMNNEIWRCRHPDRNKKKKTREPLPPIRIHKRPWKDTQLQPTDHKVEPRMFGINLETQAKKQQREQNNMAKNRLWNGSPQIQSNPYERTVHGIPQEELDPKNQKISVCKRAAKLEDAYNNFAAYQI